MSLRLHSAAILVSAGLAALAVPAAADEQAMDVPAAAVSHKADYSSIIGRVGAQAGKRPDAAAVSSAANYVNGLPRVPSASAQEPPVPLEGQTAEAVATPVVATKSATCDAYFTQSQALTAGLSSIFTAVAAKDMVTMTLQLPALDKQLTALPSAEIVAEVCDGNHVNAYTGYQYFELSALHDRGLDTGFPASLPIVKQPDLNQGVLAYIVGWIKYEKGDFAGALSSYSKGLVMYPTITICKTSISPH